MHLLKLVKSQIAVTLTWRVFRLSAAQYFSSSLYNLFRSLRLVISLWLVIDSFTTQLSEARLNEPIDRRLSHSALFHAQFARIWCCKSFSPINIKVGIWLSVRVIMARWCINFSFTHKIEKTIIRLPLVKNWSLNLNFTQLLTKSKHNR